MIKNIMQEWKLRRKSLALYAASLAGVWIFGVGIVYLSTVYGGMKKPMPMGSVCASIALVILLLIGCGTDLYMSFDFAVGFGKIRKKFLREVFCVYVINGLFLAFEVRFFQQVESSLGRWLYQEQSFIYQKSVLVSFPWMVLAVLLLISVAGAGGTVLHKFRSRGAAVLLLLWVVICVGTSREPVILNEMGESFLKLPEGVKAALILLLSGICTSISMAVMRKEAVNG